MSDTELYKILEGFRSASSEEVYKPIEENNTKIEKQGNKVIVTKDGERTEFDDEETAAMFMGGEGDEEMQEDVEDVAEDDEQLDEKWGTETDTPKSERGKYKGKTKEELKKMLANVKKTGPHKKGSKEYERQNELEFALRAKSDWGKVPEDVNEEQVDEAEQLDEFLPALAGVAARAAGAAAGTTAVNNLMGESEEPEYSTFDPENPSHRKALQRGTPVVLSPEVCSDPKGDRTGVFVNMGKSGFFGKVIRNCDGKQINVHLSDIVSADITNNSIYESFNNAFDTVMEEITVTTTSNPDSPENDTMTVTGVGPDAVDELEAIMTNAGMTKDYEAPVDDGMPVSDQPVYVEPEVAPEEPEELNASCGSMHEEDVMEDPETLKGLSLATAANILNGHLDIYDAMNDLEVPQKDRDILNREYEELANSEFATIHHPDDNIEAYMDKMYSDISDLFSAEVDDYYMDSPKHEKMAYEERDIEHANTPDEEFAKLQAIIQGMSGGINKPKKMYRKEYPGDNNMAVEGETEYDDEEDRMPSAQEPDLPSGPNYEFDPASGLSHDDEELNEKAPPGMEDWIKDRKEDFKKQYGDKWEEVLYATAWKQHNAKNEDVMQPGEALDETESFLNLYKAFTER